MPPEPQASSAEQWTVWGGELRFHWNRNMLDNLGMHASDPIHAVGAWRHMDRFAVRDASGLNLKVVSGDLRGFAGGGLNVLGGYDLMLPDGNVLALRDFSLQPSKSSPFGLDVMTNGQRWLYVDKLMYVLERDTPTFVIRSMDLRIAPELATRLGDPDVAGTAIGELRVDTPVWRGTFPEKGGSCPSSARWPGAAAPNGNTYQADVFMHDFTVTSERESSAADGPGGNNTGRVKLTPSSTLRNNVNNGTSTPTILNDPNGTSPALYAADVVWREKFFDNCPPYDNDQHPYLIWNLYRIDPLGRIEQIGRSGVKHAFLTTNVDCSEEPVAAGYVLRRGCSDTYGVTNNDSANDLGPRSEIIPASAQWGRCGSIYDTNCDGNENSPGYNAFTHRLMVQEGRIDPTNNANASYLFESWYIVRDDVNIYNTMQTRTSTFAWNGSNRWIVSHPAPNGDMLLGAAIDRWVPPGTADPNQRNSEIVDGSSHTKVAVKVTDLGGGQYRYDYAVMNFDFARPETQGNEPNLRVLSNDGFTQFALPVSQSLTVTNIEFSDGDDSKSNDWPSSVEAARIVWTAPAGNRLNWGTMFRFSLTAMAPSGPSASPIEAPVSLTTAFTKNVEVLTTASLVPQSEAVATYAVGGELAGLRGGQSVTLSLNGGAALELDADGLFGFTNEVIEGGAYLVTIDTQPTTQTCTVFNGEGNIDGADVTDVEVNCVDTLYSVGGTVSGLGVGQDLSLQLGDGEIITVDNGAFEFAAGLIAGTPYSVALTAQPFDRVCSVQSGEGIIVAGDVTNVQVACVGLETHSVGGLVSGLAPSVDVELQLNGAETLVKSGNGLFEFTTVVPEGLEYSVAVIGQPPGRNCVVDNGAGTIGESDVTNVQVVCTVMPTYSIGGSISGLSPGSGVGLQLNQATPITLTVNGSFNFPSELPDAAEYDVSVTAQPNGRTCSVVNGSGTVAAADVHDVIVACVRPPNVMFDDGFE